MAKDNVQFCIFGFRLRQAGDHNDGHLGIGPAQLAHENCPARTRQNMVGNYDSNVCAHGAAQQGERTFRHSGDADFEAGARRMSSRVFS